MKIYITEPVMVDGQHRSPGDELDVDANEAYAVIGTGRASLKKENGDAAAKAAAKAKAAEKKAE